jgi:hypothetical protein
MRIKTLSVRRLISLLSASALIATLLVVAAVPAVSAATCTPTGFYRDGINLTAAQIGGNVTGSLDATGCHVGVYYAPGTSASVTNADIFGASYYGVLATKASVNVTNSQVHDIGEAPFNGAQHGIALYFASVRSGTADDGFGNYLQPTCDTGTTTSTISGSGVRLYQKGGITANCVGTNVKVTNNTVTGLGAVIYIAQNGIQVGYGAKATVTGNTVTGNAYTGAGETSSAGILVVGGPCFGLPYTVGLDINKNTLRNNDVGVWLFNADASCSAPTTKTNNSVKLNIISNAAVTNTTGWSATCGYQAGISDVGHRDLIVNNSISGIGYTAQNPDCSGAPPAYLRFIDLDSSARGVPSNK